MLTILAIGNSFSQDATAMLHDMAAAAGVRARVVNLYIGGCSLKTHYENLLSGERAYSYELNGVAESMTSLGDALCEREWDVITLQQASHFSGLSETYYPYVTRLAQAAREACPRARIYIHETWAYAADSGHPAFEVYHKNQDEMHEMLRAAYRKAARDIEAQIIPCGDVVRGLRKAGFSDMCRDGFHIDLTYGRYALAATWLYTIAGRVSPYMPDWADAERIRTIWKCVVDGAGGRPAPNSSGI